jgi:hypothetical protein
VKPVFKQTLVVLASLVLIAFLWLCWAWFHDSAKAAAFTRVQRGDSQLQVLALLGRPFRVTGVPKNIAWDSEDSIHANRGECIQEFWYAPILQIAGEEWTVGFDVHSNVVSKYRYVSP